MFLTEQTDAFTGNVHIHIHFWLHRYSKFRPVLISFRKQDEKYDVHPRWYKTKLHLLKIRLHILTITCNLKHIGIGEGVNNNLHWYPKVLSPCYFIRWLKIFLYLELETEYLMLQSTQKSVDTGILIMFLRIFSSKATLFSSLRPSIK